MITYMRMGKASGDKSYTRKALEMALALKKRGMLIPRDSGLIEDLQGQLEGKVSRLKSGHQLSESGWVNSALTLTTGHRPPSVTGPEPQEIWLRERQLFGYEPRK